MKDETETVAVRPRRAPDATMKARLRLAFPAIAEKRPEWRCGAWVVLGTFTPQVAETLEADIRAKFPELDVRERAARG